MNSILKNNRNVILIILLIALLLFYVLPSDIKTDSKLTLTILFATLIAIIWYTIETNKMQRTMEHQLEVSISSFLALSCNKNEMALEIANVGNATAMNISIDNLILHTVDKIEVEFPRYPYLRAGDRRLFQVNTYRNKKIFDFDFYDHIVSEDHVNNNYSVVVRFEDVLRRKKHQRIKLYISGPKLPSTEELKDK